MPNETDSQIQLSATGQGPPAKELPRVTSPARIRESGTCGDEKIRLKHRRSATPYRANIVGGPTITEANRLFAGERALILALAFPGFVHSCSQMPIGCYSQYQRALMTRGTCSESDVRPTASSHGVL